MINHHPKFELIQAFVNGDLPASLSAGIAIHADMCPVCQQTIAQFTEQVAENSFEEEYLDRFIIDDNEALEAIATIDFDHMIDNIVESSDIAVVVPKVEKTVSFNDTTYTLPAALNSMEMGKHAQIGKLTRARIQLNENEIHSSLLHIQPGGGVPEHTHKGFELTVLLAGSFHDESGEYVKGDFIMLDSSHQHHPISSNGCLCYTVANDALHFTHGINKLLNPIGSFIY
ncbi:ChrR family anti-sigma-E factor [Colwellia psychrerythraea]|uniref:Putative transcriptional activator n=1 Tax=Colwellia psychrerythraea (strain 34H / ATCC BAA-681) TaxID=167879 RepID=Q485Z4_COLP3|nr:ChrR family anti-sigma-E factor [Colwellia psychrerythraea]AAZ24774.1 putative transcriptional activator [Colwellia psychrerythraea 34H]